MRQLGRVSDKEWAELKAAAERETEGNFTQWAVQNLLILARGGKIVAPDV